LAAPHAPVRSTTSAPELAGANAVQALTAAKGFHAATSNRNHACSCDVLKCIKFVRERRYPSHHSCVYKCMTKLLKMGCPQYELLHTAIGLENLSLSSHEIRLKKLQLLYVCLKVGTTQT